MNSPYKSAVHAGEPTAARRSGSVRGSAGQPTRTEGEEGISHSHPGRLMQAYTQPRCLLPHRLNMKTGAPIMLLWKLEPRPLSPQWHEIHHNAISPGAISRHRRGIRWKQLAAHSMYSTNTYWHRATVHVASTTISCGASLCDGITSSRYKKMACCHVFSKFLSFFVLYFVCSFRVNSFSLTRQHVIL